MKHLKQEFDKLTMKETLMYGLTIITMLAEERWNRIFHKFAAK